MNKDDLRKKVISAGDAVVTYRSENSKKLKYNVLTLSFDNKYISSKRNKSKEEADTLLLFCWDTDSYKLLKVKNVVSVVPLSVLLGNNYGTT